MNRGKVQDRRQISLTTNLIRLWIKLNESSDFFSAEITLNHIVSHSQLFIDSPGTSSIQGLHFVCNIFGITAITCVKFLNLMSLNIWCLIKVERSNDQKSSAIKNKNCSKYLLGRVHENYYLLSTHCTLTLWSK